MKRLGHVPALDGVRGIAIAAVCGYHFFGLRGGYFGVDVFFVLSGFLITTLLLEEHDRSGRISLRGFYSRRARRLMPALGLVLLVTGFFAYMNPAEARERIDGIAVTLFYGANIYRVLGHQLAPGLSQNWSLSAEEQFYLVWPTLLILVLAARRWNVKRLAWWLLASAVALALWRVVVVAWSGPTGRVYFAPDTHSDGLLLGCALAAALHSELLSDRALAHGRRLLPVCALVLVASFALLGSGSAAFTIGFPAVELAAAMLIAACVTSTVRPLEWKPLAWLGKISYSLYLWAGIAALLFGHTVIGVAIAVLLAWLSYRFVETRFRRRSQTTAARHRFDRLPSRRGTEATPAPQEV